MSFEIKFNKVLLWYILFMNNILFSRISTNMLRTRSHIQSVCEEYNGELNIIQKRHIGYNDYSINVRDHV